LSGVSLSTMWAKGRFSHMADSASKAGELGFTYIEANAAVSPQMLDELINAAVPLSSIRSPCPAILSSRGTPPNNLSLSSLNGSERTEPVELTESTIDLAANLGARAVVLHMGEVPVDLSLLDRLYKLHGGGYAESPEYGQVKEKLVGQRIS
jgi:sugar phosphate isomerase/epimerase